MGDAILAFMSRQSWAGGDISLTLRELSPEIKADPTLQSYVEAIGLRKIQSDGGDTAPAFS